MPIFDFVIITYKANIFVNRITEIYYKYEILY